MTYIPGNDPHHGPVPPVSGPGYLQSPHHPGWPPAIPPKKRRTGLVTGLVVAGLIALGGVGTVILATNSKPSGTQPSSISPSDAPGHIKPGQQDPGIAPLAPVAKVPPDPKGFTIGVTILTKHCFGSAGCNITFRIDPSYNGAAFTDTTTWTVTYQVNGATDAYTNSFTLTGMQASFPSEEMVSTKSSSVTLTATVTNVIEG